MQNFKNIYFALLLYYIEINEYDWTNDANILREAIKKKRVHIFGLCPKKGGRE